MAAGTVHAAGSSVKHLPGHRGSAQPASTAATPGQYDAADAAIYREMRSTLADFDASGSPKDAPPRHRAFYAALRSVLGQVLEEKTEASRHTRLAAAHQWFVKHKPRPKPADMDMAAAMAASLSVPDPTDSSAVSNARGRASGASGEAGSGGEEPHAIGRTNTSRWRERQMRLHEVDCSNNDTAGAAAFGYSHPASPQQQPGALAAAGCLSPSGLAAIPWDSCYGISSKTAVAACLPEQPSLRQVPAIQAVRDCQASGTGAMGMSPARQGSPQRRDGAPSITTTTRLSGAALSGSGGTMCASGNCSSAAGNTDGLIPLGSLPSGRFGWNNNSTTNSSCSDSGSGSCYSSSRAQWYLVAAQQQAVESAVAAAMRGYARHRARLEEEISRKQETAAQLAAAEAMLLQQQQAQTQAGGNGPAAAAGGTALGSDKGCALLHVDSQHLPGLVSAYGGLVAAAGSRVQQLVPVDKVKEAKKQLLQESQREVADVAAQLASLGVADAEVVAHALLPLPDQPYMTCMAHLPRPVTGKPARGLKKKGKKKVKTTKGKKTQPSMQKKSKSK